ELIAEYASAPTPPSPPPYPLTPLSSPLPQIHSPPLPVPSPPTHTSLTYAEAPLGYRAAMILSSDALPSTRDTITTLELIAEYASAPTPPSPPPYPLTPLSSPLPQIHSPPLPVPSPPTHTSLTYAEAPLGYRAAMILYGVGESSSDAAARPTGHTLAHRVDYGFVDTVDASIRAFESRVMTATGEVNERVTNLADIQRQDAQELYVRYEDAQDNQALPRA
nr:hypothetical protein [Tanacetum cinerariifolium]